MLLKPLQEPTIFHECFEFLKGLEKDFSGISAETFLDMMEGMFLERANRRNAPIFHPQRYSFCIGKGDIKEGAALLSRMEATADINRSDNYCKTMTWLKFEQPCQSEHPLKEMSKWNFRAANPVELSIIKKHEKQVVKLLGDGLLISLHPVKQKNKTDILVSNMEKLNFVRNKHGSLGHIFLRRNCRNYSGTLNFS